MRAPKNRLSVRVVRSRPYKMRFFIDDKTRADSNGWPSNWQGTESPKIQSPNSRETPITKPQNPVANAGTGLELAVWSFSGAWRLEFGSFTRPGAKATRRKPNPPDASLWGWAPRFPPVSPPVRSVRTPRYHRSRSALFPSRRQARGG